MNVKLVYRDQIVIGQPAQTRSLELIKEIRRPAYLRTPQANSDYKAGLNADSWEKFLSPDPGWMARYRHSLVIGAHCYTMLLNSHMRAGALGARFLSHAGYNCVEKPMIRFGHKLPSSPGEQQSGRYAPTSEAASALLIAS